MRRSQVSADDGFQPVLTALLGGLHFLRPSLSAARMSFGDGRANEIVLRLEVSIEAAVGEARIGHEAGDARGLYSLSPESRGRHVHHSFARLLLVTLLVTHGRTS